LEWGPVQPVAIDGARQDGAPDFVAGVRAIKAGYGPDIVLAGSSSLTSALLEHGLADELVLMVDPVLLGKGKRLFAEGTPPRAFTLESTRSTPTGIVVQSYKATGGLKNLG
jgi:dihydrofolate reductase